MQTPLSQFESLDRWTLPRELERETAIKCTNTCNRSDAGLAERLPSEAKLLVQLSHLNIAQVHDVVKRDITLGSVIELIGRDTLTQRHK